MVHVLTWVGGGVCTLAALWAVFPRKPLRCVTGLALLYLALGLTVLTLGRWVLGGLLLVLGTALFSATRWVLLPRKWMSLPASGLPRLTLERLLGFCLAVAIGLLLLFESLGEPDVWVGCLIFTIGLVGLLVRRDLVVNLVAVNICGQGVGLIAMERLAVFWVVLEIVITSVLVLLLFRISRFQRSLSIDELDRLRG